MIPSNALRNLLSRPPSKPPTSSQPTTLLSLLGATSYGPVLPAISLRWLEIVYNGLKALHDRWIVRVELHCVMLQDIGYRHHFLLICVAHGDRADNIIDHILVDGLPSVDSLTAWERWRGGDKGDGSSLNAADGFVTDTADRVVLFDGDPHTVVPTLFNNPKYDWKESTYCPHGKLSLGKIIAAARSFDMARQSRRWAAPSSPDDQRCCMPFAVDLHDWLYTYTIYPLWRTSLFQILWYSMRSPPHKAA